jgi:hypothetical protein
MGSTKYPLIAPPGGGFPNLPQPGQPTPLRNDEFQSGSIANVTEFNFKGIAPPTALYMQRDDILSFIAASNLLNEQITFTGRFLRVPEPMGGQPSDGGVGRAPGGVITHGIIEFFQEVVAFPVAGIGRLTTRNFAEGYLLSIAANCNTSTVRGRSFARASLVRAPFLNAAPGQLLFGDYVTIVTPAGYPNGRALHTTEGPGWKHSVQQANPGAGADWTFTLGATQRMRIESLNAVLTASAAVANRQVQLIVDDGVNVVGFFPASVNIVASAVANVTATSGSVNTPVITTDVSIPIPQPLILEPGWRLRTSTVGIQAGDQWSAIWLNVEEWLEGV